MHSQRLQQQLPWWHNCYSSSGKPTWSICNSISPSRRCFCFLVFPIFVKKSPAHPDRPRIITVSYWSASGCLTPLIQNHFPGLSQSTLITRGSKGERLNMPLQLWYSPSASQNRSPVNCRLQRNLWQGLVWAIHSSQVHQYSTSGLYGNRNQWFRWSCCFFYMYLGSLVYLYWPLAFLHIKTL